MRIALVDTTPRAKVYPLGLMKLSAWRKDLGDSCDLFIDKLPKAKEYDQIWISTTFTFHIPHALSLVREAKKRADKVWVGGISASLMPKLFKSEGAEVHCGLLPEAESFSPDYDLLGIPPQYSISHTSRGCVRKCKFCMVHKLEPEFSSRTSWEEDIHPATNKVLFYDNNWLAKPLAELKSDVDIMRRMVADGKIKSMDFNQALDARLINCEVAGILKGLPIVPVRFSFDGMHEDGYVQDAVRMMADVGFKEFTIFCLYNFKDKPTDLYYRLREVVRLSVDLGITCYSFPMRYQPIMEVDSRRNYVGGHWSAKEKAGFMSILNQQSIAGQISKGSIDEFEYWFGKDAEEFCRLLKYPDVGKLMKRKKGYLRMERALKLQ